jgi:hypothetical protein
MNTHWCLRIRASARIAASLSDRCESGVRNAHAHSSSIEYHQRRLSQLSFLLRCKELSSLLKPWTCSTVLPVLYFAREYSRVDKDDSVGSSKRRPQVCISHITRDSPQPLQHNSALQTAWAAIEPWHTFWGRRYTGMDSTNRSWPGLFANIQPSLAECGPICPRFRLTTPRDWWCMPDLLARGGSCSPILRWTVVYVRLRTNPVASNISSFSWISLWFI